jgi:SAM-dependent methyltransferase
MKLADIPKRKLPPAPWELGEKIPWHEPEFSRRMLEQHLSQAHDWASRRLEIIDRQIDWLARQLPGGNARILDLGCGPGLYLQRLAKLGHACTGIDFSPASIAYAKAQAEAEKLPIEYILDDLRQHEIQGEFDLIMMLFGEINVFRENEAEAILVQAARHLKKGGRLVIEAHPFAEIRRQGQRSPGWQANEKGLFSDRPHLYLQEHFWDEPSASQTTRHLIIDAENADVQEFGTSMKAYTDEQYRKLFEKAGLGKIEKLTAATWPVGGVFEGKLQVFSGQV